MFLSEIQKQVLKYSHIFNKHEFVEYSRAVCRHVDELQRVSSCHPSLWSCSPASTFQFPHWCSAAYLGQQDAYTTCDLVKILVRLCLWNPVLSLTFHNLRVRVQDCDIFNILCCFDETLRNEIPFFPPSGHPSANYTFLQSMLPLLFHHKEKKKNAGSDVANGVCHMSSPHCLIPECRHCEVM